MLKELKVQNYALIQNLDIEFDNDFSTLTGETGAGKSILLGALSLILGARADISALKNNQNKCIVEGIFKIEKYNLTHFFNNRDIDYEPETLIRREINTSGKSRAFINDTPVNLNILKELTTLLIDIHSQHESLSLNDNLYQLKVIDSVAQNSKLLNEYQTVFKQFKDYQKKLEHLKEQAKIATTDYDYNLFQYNQLNDLKLDEIDQKALENDLQILNNAEEIQQNLSACHSILYEDELNTINQLKSVKQWLTKIKSFYQQSGSLIDRIEGITIDLKDIAQEIELSAEKIEFNPNRAQQIKEVLDGLYSAMLKHNADSIDELIQIQNEFKNKLDTQSSANTEINELENRLSETTGRLELLSNKLSSKRNSAIAPFTKKITSHLTELGMPYAKFTVKIEGSPHFQPEGKDNVTFMFSANKNQPEQNIAKIASGGEISRLMLSIKSIMSESTALPTIIFDEIDTGVSGEIADKMATIMKQMAQNMQVISITHLPQIAARSKNHYKVFKQENGQSVQTKIIKLNNAEHIDEIARLLSGKDISKEAIENAKTLINS